MRLFKQYVAVKPVEANNPHTQWLVVNETPFHAFFDDLFRYGVSVAWYNLKWHMQNDTN